MSTTPAPSSPSRPHVVQPMYQKLSIILLGLVALFYALSYAKPILVPVLFAMLLAMLLNPMVNMMTRRGVPRLLGITLSVLVAMLALAGLAYFIVTQAMHFSETLPDLKEKLATFGQQIERWVQRSAGLEPREVDDAVQKVKEESMAKGGALVGRTLTTAGTLFGFFFLLPVFTFLLLLYKGLLITFLTKLFPHKDQGTLSEVLDQTKGVTQSYLKGLIIEAGIITVLNWVGLMVIGVPYALLLAVLASVLNLIPYIGMITATILPMLIAVATTDPINALWVLALYSAVQFLDNNLIVPRVVASRVQLNALVSILVVMIGGVLWGIPGMFLSLPLTAMLKVVFDRVPALQPFGYVLGDGDPKPDEARSRSRKLR
jgi:predicted PurR-regulated permease PerM